MKQLDGCAHMLCWHTVLLLKLKLVLCFQLYEEYEICLYVTHMVQTA